MEYSPKLSVVVSAYNAELYIKESIDSILNQTFSDFELLIYNDGSVDFTAEIIRNFNDKRIILTDSKVNKGVVYWSNVGLKQARGKYILRFDADDINKIERFQKQWDFMESNPEIGASSSQLEIMGTGELVSKPILDKDIRWWFFKGCPLIQGAVIIRKSVLEEFDLKYNESFKSAEDLELWIQLAKVTKLANLNEPLFEYRVHELQESTANINRQDFYRDMSLKAFFSWLGIDNQEKDLVFARNLFEGLIPFSSNNMIKINRFFLSLKSSNAIGFFGENEILDKRWHYLRKGINNLTDYSPYLFFHIGPLELFKALDNSLVNFSMFVAKSMIFWKTRKV